MKDGQKVSFDPRVIVYTEETKWIDDYKQARNADWEQYARDRERFKRRIAVMESILTPILNNNHRYYATQTHHMQS